MSTWKAWYKDAAAAGVAAAASAAAIDATTTFVVVKSMSAAEAAAATPAAAWLYQAFQVDTKGLKLNGGHFVPDNFKRFASVTQIVLR